MAAPAKYAAAIADFAVEFTAAECRAANCGGTRRWYCTGGGNGKGNGGAGGNPGDDDSSSSSSSGNPDDLGSNLSEELVKLGERREAKEVLSGLTEVRRRKKKLQIPKPELYYGGRDSGPICRKWKQAVGGYLRFHRDAWEDDADLITTIIAFMKGKACDWIDNRARTLRANRKVDTFSTFFYPG